MNRDYKSIQRLSHDEIQAHILDPENNPLPERCQEQFNRVLEAARLLDDYPNDNNVVLLLQAKYPVSKSTAIRDINLARELYKTQHSFDWDFWFAWQVKDQLELIRECKISGDRKEWNKAKKVLHDIIGDRPMNSEDPKRMERNEFFIQVINNGETKNVSLGDARNWKPNEVKEVIDAMYEPITEDDAKEIMDT
jgi:hypothetical protein